MTADDHHQPHGSGELCEVGLRLYARALRDGPLPGASAPAAPCLTENGLLYSVEEDMSLLRPVAPTVALQRLLRTSADRIAEERRRGQDLADVFEPLIRLGAERPVAEDAPALRIISGKTRANEVIAQTMIEGHQELLTIQPYDGVVATLPHVFEEAMARDQAFVDGGGWIRALYQHSVRHTPYVRARYERLTGDVEARTLDEITERLIVVDRAVAFIPASTDRSLALEVRHPALVSYFVTTFERLWRLATPLYPEKVHQPVLDGITARGRAIAALLVEGHTDADIAERLGMNVRTARVHIARLAAALGSGSRAQLGYLIAESGILKQEQSEGLA
ncbi:helix-turn-helix transcriptional regulator [Streptomyces sp. NPDC003717]|uniref:helix-turn-helix transcriptional regulator n=1 Tax=Streptomyces sp. NPDC003717 TaxID=3154276 RepID=UPI0033BB5408